MIADAGNTAQAFNQVVEGAKKAEDSVRRLNEQQEKTQQVKQPVAPVATPTIDTGTQSTVNRINQATSEAMAKVKQISAAATVPPVSDEVPKSHERATVSIKQLAAGFAIAQGAIMMVEAALRKIVGVIGSFINVNSQMEQVRMQFKVMIGDAKKYQEIFAATKKFADTTPFTDIDTYRAGQQLLSAQIKDLNEYKAALATVGDLAAASGRPIQEVAGAYARLKSGASGEAMEALRQMNISRSMFEAKGIQFDSSGQALATSQQMTKALDEIVKSNFGGLTQELSTKWAGLWSTFSSNVDNAARAVTGGAFLRLEAGLAGINGAMEKALNDPDSKIYRLGAAITSIVGAIGGLSDAFGGLFGPAGLSAIQMITEAIAGVSLAISGFTLLSRMAQAAVQFLWDTMTMSGNAKQNFVANMMEATNSYNKQTAAAKTAFGIQLDLTKQEDVAQEDSAKKAARLNQEKAMAAVEYRNAIVQNTKTIMTVQESLWAVEKAKGRDSVQLAQMEMEQRKLNLSVLQEAESKLQASQGAAYKKSASLLEAESKYAQSIAAYYDALIAKREALGEFVTNTSKLLAEADAIDKRGGDSGVKRYAALKSAVDEYMDSLKKLQELQRATETNSAKMQAAAGAVRSGSLTQYQNEAAVIEQGEKVFQVNALQERLAQIQRLSQAQNLGARERFGLYEQERQIFSELTGSIGSAIEGTMQKIQSMQSAAIGAASSAVGILEKVGASESDYQALARMVSGLRLDTGNMNLQNLGQYASLIESLQKKGASVDGMMPSVNEVFGALQKELTGVPEAINKLQGGLQSLAGLSAQVGAAAAENFWKPWNDKLAELKAQFSSLSMTNFSPVSSVPAPVSIPVPASRNPEPTTVQVNAQTNLSFQGYTQDQAQNIVTQAKEKFGDELMAALQSANAQYGF